MKLYYSKSACSLVVRIIIHEIGLSCEYEAVDLKTKKTETGADFLKINYKGAVPTLVLDNHEVLTENAIILQYLADTSKAYQLLPPVTEFKRYRVLEWLNYITTELHKSFGLLFKQNVPETFKNDILIPLLKTKFDYVNQSLMQKKFLLGDEFTLPDAYLYVMLRWLSAFKIDLKEWPYLTHYFDELKNRPAIKKALQEEGLAI